MSTSEGSKGFFQIPFAYDLMQKSPTQVLAECSAFDAELATDDELHDYRVYGQFDAMVHFFCDFKLRDYQAFSTVTISFVENKAVECVISLGEPANLKRYSSETEVTKVFLVALEELYRNGRIQEEDEPGTRAYTWKKDNRTIVSFISYPPSGRITDAGAWLGVQIRDTQLHPQGAYFELLYDRAQKPVQDLGYVTLHRNDEPLEKVYERRGTRYHLTSFLMWTAIILGIIGIVSLVSKNFATGTILIILAVLCAFLMSKLDYGARRDYRQKRKSVQESNSPTQRVDTASVEALDISSQLESFCRDYITALGEALDIAIRVNRKEYEAGFNEAMDLLCSGIVVPGLGLRRMSQFQFAIRMEMQDNSFQLGIPKKDRPPILAEIRLLAGLGGIPYNKMSPLNQFIVTIQPYVYYCLEKYLPNDPSLREEAKRLMNTRGCPRYLQENLGYPISQIIKGAFWIPKPFGFLARLFGFGIGRRH